MHLARFTNPDMTDEAYRELFTADAIQEYPFAPYRMRRKYLAVRQSPNTSQIL